MENKEQTDSSSFTADLFGSDKSPPSTGIFASIFPPPSTAMGRNYASSEFRGSMQKQPAGSQVFGCKQGTQDNVDKNIEGASHKGRKSIFQERLDPCPLSSSLYYGGQEDMYIKSSSAQTPESYPIFKKDGGEDDDPNEKASRGNWWQGSLYY
ncbi:hypothetical protein LguiA_020906 [Lonicera macranthoides]